MRALRDSEGKGGSRLSAEQREKGKRQRGLGFGPSWAAAGKGTGRGEHCRRWARAVAG